MPISASSMISALTNVERAVTQLFLQGQVGKVIGPIQSGWLEASSSTLNLSNDTVSLSPAIFKSLLSLADIQALISDVSPRDPLPLLRDVSNALTSMPNLSRGSLKMPPFCHPNPMNFSIVFSRLFRTLKVSIFIQFGDNSSPIGPGHFQTCFPFNTCKRVCMACIDIIIKISKYQNGIINK